MVDEIDFRYSNLGLFPERGGYKFTFQFFEDSNEKIMGRDRKGIYSEVW